MEWSAEVLSDVVKRLRRVQGQVGGLIQMIESGRDCQEVTAQLAAASHALDRAGFRLVLGGLEQCVSDGSAQGKADREQWKRLFLRLG